VILIKYLLDYLDRPSTTLLNSPAFYTELTNLLGSEGNHESLETLSNLLLPITKLDATACKGRFYFELKININQNI
jgi:hypothetical protein